MYKANGMKLSKPPAVVITYLSRCCLSSRYVVNEYEVMKTLKALNPSSSLENFDGKSFQYQVDTMRKTTVMISMHGAQMTNLVFMYPGSIVVEIVNPQFYYFFYQELSRIANMRHVLFQNTTIIEYVPDEVRKKWWNPNVNYKIRVNISCLIMTLSHLNP